MSSPCNLRALIDAAIDKKQGDKQFLLSYDEMWWAEIGNPVSAVRLGESGGEYVGRGATPEEAVKELLEKLP
jgi:hypothetical protein